MATIDKIAKQVGGAMKAAGMTKPATLTVVTPSVRTPGVVSGGTNATETSVAARGLVTSWRRQRLGGTDVAVGDRVVLLFGSLIAGGVAPKVGDKITIEGTVSRIIDIERDSASATYSCLTRQ